MNDQQKRRNRKIEWAVSIIICGILIGGAIIWGSKHQGVPDIRPGRFRTNTWEEEQQYRQEMEKLKQLQKNLISTTYETTVEQSLREQIGEKLNLQDLHFLTLIKEGQENAIVPNSKYWDYAIVYDTKENENGKRFVGLVRFDTGSAFFHMENMSADGPDTLQLFDCPGKMIDSQYMDTKESGGYVVFSGLEGPDSYMQKVDLYFGFAPNGSFIKNGASCDVNSENGDNEFAFWVQTGEEVKLEFGSQ